MKNTTYTLSAIGTVNQDQGSRILIAPEYRAALAGLDEFSHVMVFWLFDKAPWDGKTLTTPPCYRKLDHELGLFATRGPFRPNPVAVTNCRILSLDKGAGVLILDWIDAEPDTPVIDLKPYHPSSDVVTDLTMPAWCDHWPKSREASGNFDWGAEFTF
jgi:tRNA-Thr(GGU) m(6)t(6)A37 methyltransferase TsaA